MYNAIGPTLDQRRAHHAWEAVARMAKCSDGRQKAYRREAKRFPVRIMIAGLGQALAFLQAKSGEANEELLRDIADWVLDKRDRPESKSERPKDRALTKRIIESDGIFLRKTTDEVLAYMQWLSRFAEAELEDE